jgi:hypothetical protein
MEILLLDFIDAEQEIKVRLGEGGLGEGDDNDTRSEAATRYNSEIFRFDEILSWIK